MIRRAVSILSAVFLLAPFGACRQQEEPGPVEEPERAAESEQAAAPSEAAPPVQRRERRRERRRVHRPGMGRGMGPGTGMCAMEVPDAEVAMEETEDGVALTFTTTEDNRDKLREVVEAMSERHRGRFGVGHRHRGGRGMMGRGGMGRGMRMVPSSAEYEEVDEGARLVLTPTDGEDLETLRQHMRWHLERMQSGECPMWKMYQEAEEETPEEEGGAE
ncbi:MAG: hypothetical protein ACQEXJ_15375 [Myxococcota bacterium]